MTRLLLLQLLFPVVGLAAAESITVNAQVQVHGLPGCRASNGLITLGVVPVWGGRCLQFDLGERPLFYTDPATRGAVLDPGPGPDTHWQYINVGGFRIWPAPQSAWKRNGTPIQMWPPPPRLDHGATSLHTAADGMTCHGGPETDPRWRCTGMQFSYTYRLLPQEATAEVSCTATNLAGHPQRWGMWDVTAVPAGDGVEIIWPLRREGRSRFGDREWMLQSGDDADPQWSTDRTAGVVRVRCQGRTGKIAGDTDGGWIAMYDRRDGVAYVKRFSHDIPAWKQMRYPEGGSTVSVFVNATFAEVEVMTPEFDYDPGQQQIFAMTWHACRVGDAPLAVQDAGIISRRLAASSSNGRVQVTGGYGVFAHGTLRLEVDDASRTVLWESPVTPMTAITLDQSVSPPAGATRAELVLVTQSGERRVLDRCTFP